MKNKEQIISRKEADRKNCWNLDSLFKSDDEWDKSLEQLKKLIEKAGSFKGKIGKSADNLLECLEYLNSLGMLEEKLGYYAHLKQSEDGSDSKNQERISRYTSLAAKAGTETSYITPEIMAIPDDMIKKILSDEKVKQFSIYLDKLLRFKPHVLSESEEKLLSLQAEANQTAKKAFSSLTDIDMDFGTVKQGETEKPLTQSTFSSFMMDPDRDFREKVYFRFYSGYDSHRNTLAALFAGSIHLDVYSARARKHNSAREAALFPDRVPVSVYDNLVQAVRDNLPVLHEYYRFRTKALGIDKMRLFDVYVPLIKEIRAKNTYDEAVEKVISSLGILGDEYCSVLKKGLTGGWVDRYENKGKRSGAFSAGSYTGEPYILMNYKEDVLRDVFTLAHEAGHSMHSWYSSGNNPFQHYDYTIFEAEVASTFNEQLLAKYLVDNAESREMKAYLLSKQIDDIIATIFRQTMFAQYEQKVHEMAEQGLPLTVDTLREEYGKLLKDYFGPETQIEQVSSLEGLRIPHFYRAFYVYKYATGLSAAIALSSRVINGSDSEIDDYIGFLKSGGSKYPLESLKLAGVDMEKPEPVHQALKRFKELVDEMKMTMQI